MVVAADLVTLYGGVLVFLQRRSCTVQFRFDRCVRLVYLLFERLVPAEENHRRNNHDLNHQSHNV
jgi:hypothetical protein